MTDSTMSELCRVTVRAPAKSIDLAVPAHVPVADLLPILVRYAGDDLAEQGLEHGGWVLQRLGDRPLDEDASLESLGVVDGETLHLRPHTDALPEVALDDIVEGVAQTMETQPFAWSAPASRRVLLGLVVLTLAAGLTVLAWPGPSGGLRALAASATGLLLLGGAASASRAVGDAEAGAALGFAAVPYAALAGWLLPGGALGGPDQWEVLGARLLAAGAAAAGGAMLAVAAVAAFAALFLALVVVAAVGVLAGALMMTTDLGPGHVAGLIALAAVILGAFVPSMSFRLSGLRMPPLPSNAEQLQEGIEPHSPSSVAARTVSADGWMTGLYAATALICAACLFGLAHRFTLPTVLMAGALSLLLLLHSRALGNILQRLSLVAAGVWGGALLIHGAAAHASGAERLLLVAGLAAVAAALAITSWTVPGRRLVPYWGRAGEILHSAMAISLLPLALWVLGVYGLLRAMNG
ncbi:type VII secretion integral membrane protein EccD [Streptomyces sp. NBC_00654]|uniref:type VII secretion integral membrane protein EccD n=1 Tax=Streptomyces sp. NBC_00654 TaxID=2975799 RepID=UPI00224E4155|nr:type VII secretion integral membrane protein EccD [Streptomyces sp. NBC_00654]MCX4966947.1 type VII secretion integral membrane protein EccD [Streptomyces sp. NBC_00654]